MKNEKQTLLFSDRPVAKGKNLPGMESCVAPHKFRHGLQAGSYTRSIIQACPARDLPVDQRFYYEGLGHQQEYETNQRFRLFCM